jgi:hypothetical protein
MTLPLADMEVYHTHAHTCTITQRQAHRYSNTIAWRDVNNAGGDAATVDLNGVMDSVLSHLGLTVGTGKGVFLLWRSFYREYLSQFCFLLYLFEGCNMPVHIFVRMRAACATRMCKRACRIEVSACLTFVVLAVSESFTARTKMLLFFDWFRCKIFGRDISRY